MKTRLSAIALNPAEYDSRLSTNHAWILSKHCVGTCSKILDMTIFSLLVNMLLKGCQNLQQELLAGKQIKHYITNQALMNRALRLHQKLK